MQSGWIRRYRIPLTIVAAVLLYLVVAIDHPLRDFTTNHAEIAEDSTDQRLRPRVYDLTIPEVVEAIEQAALRISNWEYVGDAGVGDVTQILFVRTSRVWRFKDDVTLKLETRDGRTVVTGESRSRVGVGDLGQNPRNLHRILSELDTVLGL